MWWWGGVTKIVASERVSNFRFSELEPCGVSGINSYWMLVAGVGALVRADTHAISWGWRFRCGRSSPLLENCEGIKLVQQWLVGKQIEASGMFQVEVSGTCGNAIPQYINTSSPRPLSIKVIKIIYIYVM